MKQNQPVQFAIAIQKANEWIHELMDALGTDDPEQCYRALRATLHTLRDRLDPNEAVHLAAQLPMLIRGVYFESWTPSKTPTGGDVEDFLQGVAGRLAGRGDYPPQDASRAVFHLLTRHVSDGEMHHVVQGLPERLKTFFLPPAEKHARSTR